MYSQPAYVYGSSSSASSGGSRSQGDVPGCVRDLLLATRELQSYLRRWSIGQATEQQVSDVFVQVGTLFNTTIRAFAYHHIDLSDIHSVPKDLRTALEGCLAEDPSPATLAAFEPEVRRVLYRLLRGLQARQEVWRQVSGGQVPMLPPDFR